MRPVWAASNQIALGAEMSAIFSVGNAKLERSVSGALLVASPRQLALNLFVQMAPQGLLFLTDTFEVHRPLDHILTYSPAPCL